jgi:hypothetical protein
MMAVFRFFFVLFSLRSILLQISMFRIDAKQAEKISLLLLFRFISLRSENDGAPYAEPEVGGKYTPRGLSQRGLRLHVG